MPDAEDRIATLERKVAMLELLRAQQERKAEASRPPAQVQNLKEINENMTMLLGIASGQEGSIKEIEADVSTIKEHLESVDQRLDRLESTSNQHTALLNQHTGLLNQHTALLNQHTTLLNQHTTLLNQILERLPEKPR